MERLIQDFIIEVHNRFVFLEKEYGYKKYDNKIESRNYFPDSQITVKYIGKAIGIEVYWYFAGANIGVTFVELNKGKFPTQKVFVGEAYNASRAIDLYTLARYLEKWDDSIFLLKDNEDVQMPKIKKREKEIRENMPEIIEGLSNGVIKIANNIISGDTSIFADVMKYKTALINKEYL